MAWDIKMDGETRDWVFTASRDYAHVEGMDIVKQRVMTRLFIERGTFIYDVQGDLGSRTWELLRFPHWKSEEQLNITIQEALAPMDDVEIIEVEVWSPGQQFMLGQQQQITYEPDVRQVVVTVRVKLRKEFELGPEEAASEGQDFQVGFQMGATGLTV
jgi:hypothetical protein